MRLKPDVYEYDRFRGRLISMDFNEGLALDKTRDKDRYFIPCEGGINGIPCFMRGRIEDYFVINPFCDKSINSHTKLDGDIKVPVKYVDSLKVIC